MVPLESPVELHHVILLCLSFYSAIFFVITAVYRAFAE